MSALPTRKDEAWRYSDLAAVARHWPVAVEWHSANHPETIHICQDLHQAVWICR